MIVITGPIGVVSWPSASRRAIPRSTASAAASACATLNETVALTLMPRYVASSMAAIPARGGRELDDDVRRQPVEAEGLGRPWPAASRKRVGSVWIERRPARPPEASKAGMRSGAARTLISATIAHASSRSDQVGCSAASSRTRVGPAIGVLLPVVDHDRRVGGGADRAEVDGVASSSTLQLSFQMSVGVSAIGSRRAGVSVRVCIGPGALTDRCRVPRCNRLHDSGRGNWAQPAAPHRRADRRRVPGARRRHATRPASPATAAGP